MAPVGHYIVQAGITCYKLGSGLRGFFTFLKIFEAPTGESDSVSPASYGKRLSFVLSLDFGPQS